MKAGSHCSGLVVMSGYISASLPACCYFLVRTEFSELPGALSGLALSSNLNSGGIGHPLPSLNLPNMPDITVSFPPAEPALGMCPGRQLPCLLWPPRPQCVHHFSFSCSRLFQSAAFFLHEPAQFSSILTDVPLSSCS